MFPIKKEAGRGNWKWRWNSGFWLLLCALASGAATRGQTKTTGRDEVKEQLVIIDTDIGDDVDDAFALGLALQSPELKILGITTAWGNTPLRARLVGRLLAETGRQDILVAVGIEKYPANAKPSFSQARYAERGPQQNLPGAVDFLLEQIKKHPGEITLIAIGPETNLGAAIEREPETFRKLKRVVLMGGSVYRGYDGSKGERRPADAEWNISRDPAGAKALLAAGVPVFMMPLD